MKRRALTPSEIAAFWPGLSDPDTKIAECIAGFKETGNPFYVWLAAEICIAAKRQFPAQVLDYLRQGAARMRSLQASKLHSRRAAILAHASAAYFKLFLSAGLDARAARLRHCLACCLYSATTRIASRYYAWRTAGVRAHPALWITFRAATPRTYSRHQNARIGDGGILCQGKRLVSIT